MTTLFVGVTAGPALAETGTVQMVASRASVGSESTAAPVTPSASPTAVPNWSAAMVSGGSVTAVKSTPVRWFEPNQSADTGTNVGGRIALVWAVAAAVVMAGVLGGGVLGRHRR